MIPRRRGADVGELSNPNVFGQKPRSYGLEVGAPEIDSDPQEAMFALGGAHPDVAKLTHILGFLGRGPEEDVAQIPGQADFLLEHEFGGQEPVGPPNTLDPNFGFSSVPEGALGPNMAPLSVPDLQDRAQEPSAYVDPPAPQFSPDELQGPEPSKQQRLIADAIQNAGGRDAVLAKADASMRARFQPSEPSMGTRLDLAKQGNDKDLMWANWMLENGFYGG